MGEGLSIRDTYLEPREGSLGFIIYKDSLIFPIILFVCRLDSLTYKLEYHKVFLVYIRINCILNEYLLKLD